MLERLRAQGREPSAEEKATLALYAGYGGLRAMFKRKPAEAWARDAREDLAMRVDQDTLNALEISSANAHYTPVGIAREMWAMARRLGFQGGRVLEPGCGIGHFISTIPEDLYGKVQVTGVEAEPLAAQIAGVLHEGADIRQGRYEHQELPQGYYDLVIGNVPFGETRVRHKGGLYSLHDYFIRRSFEHLRPGGLMVVLTSRFTMDKANAFARTEFAKQAKLLGAFRLPENMQKVQADATAVEDVLVFRRLAEGENPDYDFLDTRELEIDGQASELSVNDYFLEHPENVIGEFAIGQRYYGAELSVKMDGGAEAIARALHERVEALSAPSIEPEPEAAAPVDEAPVEEDENAPGVFTLELASRPMVGTRLRHGQGFVEVVGAPWRDAKSGAWRAEVAEVAVTGKTAEALGEIIDVRDAMSEALSSQANDMPDWEARLEALDQRYEAFVSHHGHLNKRNNQRLLGDDPMRERVLALELVDEETKEVRKSDMLRGRIIEPQSLVRLRAEIETPADALAVAIGMDGRLVPETLARLLDKTPEEAIGELVRERLVFERIDGDGYEPAFIYLSGNVRDKLRQAESAAEIDPERFGAHVEALREVQPEPLGIEDISVNMGAPWIEARDFMDFANEITGHDGRGVDEAIEVTYIDALGQWELTPFFPASSGVVATAEWGTERANFARLMDSLMNQREIAIYDSIPDGEGGTLRVLNHDETTAAQQKARQIEERFSNWLWEDPERAERLLTEYNERYNGYVSPDFKLPGNWRIPGMNRMVVLYPTQINAVVREVIEERGLLSHEVGMGKTYTLIAAAMELSRLGKANRPIITVPKSTLGQFSASANFLFPEADILVMHPSDLSSAKRRNRFLSRAANNHYDIIICSHEAFSSLEVGDDFERRIIHEELARFRSEQEALAESGSRGFTQRLIMNRIDTLERRLSDVTKKSDGDRGVSLRTLGSTAVAVDEIHLFKNLVQGTKRAMDMLVKCEAVRMIRGDQKGVIGATGTPIANSLNEIHTLGRYICPDVLDRIGCSHLQAFRSNFIREKVEWEPHHAGAGWRLKSRDTMVNAADFMRAMHATCMDHRTVEDDLEGIVKRPIRNDKTHIIPMSDAQKAVMADIARRAMSPDSEGENHVFALMNRAAKASLDMELLSDWGGEGGKTEGVSEKIREIYDRTSEVRGTQLVFCDLGTPGGSAEINLYEKFAEALVERGIPRDQIAFIHDARTDKQRVALQEKMNRGEKRVIFGSTSKMGIGMNAQERIAAIHHVTYPFRPDIKEQADGRGVRQGNRFETVDIINHVSSPGEGNNMPYEAFVAALLKRKSEDFKRVLVGEVRKFDPAVSMSYGEIAVAASGNPLLKDRLACERETAELTALLRSKQSERLNLNRRVRNLRTGIEMAETRLAFLNALPATDPGREWEIEGEAVTHDEMRARLMSEAKKAGQTSWQITYGGAPVDISFISNGLHGHRFHFSIGLSERVRLPETVVGRGPMFPSDRAPGIGDRFNAYQPAPITRALRGRDEWIETTQAVIERNGQEIDACTSRLADDSELRVLEEKLGAAQERAREIEAKIEVMQRAEEERGEPAADPGRVEIEFEDEDEEDEASPLAASQG